MNTRNSFNHPRYHHPSMCYVQRCRRLGEEMKKWSIHVIWFVSEIPMHTTVLSVTQLHKDIKQAARKKSLHMTVEYEAKMPYFALISCILNYWMSKRSMLNGNKVQLVGGCLWHSGGSYVFHKHPISAKHNTDCLYVLVAKFLLLNLNTLIKLWMMGKMMGMMDSAATDRAAIEC